MVVACWCFGSMGFIMKLAYVNNPILTGIDVLLVRSWIMLPVYYIIAKFLKVNLIKIKEWHFAVLLFRCITGAIGMSMLFISIKLLPTSIAFMIFNLNPLFVTLFAFWWLSEELKYVNAFWAFGAFGGVILVAYGRKDETTFDMSEIIAIGIWLGAAFLCSLAVASMRRLNQLVHYIFSPYYLWIMCILWCLWYYIYDQSYINIQHYNEWDWIFLSTAGWFSLVGQLLLSLAFKYSNASSAAPLLYINWLFNIFADLFYFKLEFYYCDLGGAGVITVWVFIPLLMLIIDHHFH